MNATITITDPDLLAKLTAAPGFVEIRDPAGRVLGTFFLDGYGVPPPGVTSPISDKEFEEARKQTGGKPLAEILKRLQAGEER
ncbi:MAG: hypothetical protein J0I06_26420 [Planctomycetes bacterium]|nr:hypothetical protein [Planctomycetota bacterium]